MADWINLKRSVYWILRFNRSLSSQGGSANRLFPDPTPANSNHFNDEFNMVHDPSVISLLPMPTPGRFDPARVAESVSTVASFPSRLAGLIAGMESDRLASTYREGGWTVTEIVHHVVDSHLHSYMRCKYAICEDVPKITPYEENDWVRTPECGGETVPDALLLLELLHRRWVRFFRGLDEAAWNRTFHHPGSGRDFAVFQQVEIYAWHGDHHLAQAAMALGKAFPS